MFLLTLEVVIANCLISPLFPYKLLALQSFTNKGHTIIMTGDTMSISNHYNGTVLKATKNIGSGLYFLHEYDEEKNGLKKSEVHISLLAHRYGDVQKFDVPSELWKLHLRHGHRNFNDICRQYSIPVPKQTPACTSCVMGKSHTHPHQTDGFDRATRKAQGFHSDFRGPFSVPTPAGYLYLLTLIDDCSRRIFPFLTKSQTEWFDI
jgi:hypothetical protein